MRERISVGMRLTSVNEFFHWRMVAKAIETFKSIWEIKSRVNLQRQSAYRFLTEFSTVQ